MLYNFNKYVTELGAPNMYHQAMLDAIRPNGSKPAARLAKEDMLALDVIAYLIETVPAQDIALGAKHNAFEIGQALKYTSIELSMLDQKYPVRGVSNLADVEYITGKERLMQAIDRFATNIAEIK